MVWVDVNFLAKVWDYAIVRRPGFIAAHRCCNSRRGKSMLTMRANGSKTGRRISEQIRVHMHGPSLYLYLNIRIIHVYYKSSERCGWFSFLFLRKELKIINHEHVEAADVAVSSRSKVLLATWWKSGPKNKPKLMIFMSNFTRTSKCSMQNSFHAPFSGQVAKQSLQLSFGFYEVSV